MKVFLSHSFRPEDRHLVAKIDSLLGAQDVLVATGRRLGGAAITPEILRRIETTDALVALLTRRERIGEEEAGRWTTHNWVRDEINYARGRDKPAIALVEAGVELDGAYEEHERITFDRDNPLDALLELAETIHVWREGLGVQRQVQIKPDDIGEELRKQGKRVDVQVSLGFSRRGARRLADDEADCFSQAEQSSLSTAFSATTTTSRWRLPARTGERSGGRRLRPNSSTSR